DIARARRRNKKRGSLDIASDPRKKPRQRPTLPQSRPCSTIGPGGLYFRVRDGNGCDPSGIAARKKLKREATCVARCNPRSGISAAFGQPPPCDSRAFRPVRRRKKKVVKPHDQLVPVSFTHC